MMLVLGELRLAFSNTFFQTTLSGNAAGCCGLSFLDWWESALDGREIFLMLELLEVASSSSLSPRIDNPFTFRSSLNAFSRLSFVCFTIGGLSLWVPFW